jgi:pyruvate kinase
MKTKIVATIGSKSSYKEGIFDLKGKKIEPNKITYDYLVREFCNHGVGLIRLNLAYIDIDDIENVFLEIKNAILKWEKKKMGRRVAVLVDLPGPKIRFHIEQKLNFKVGSEFNVHFDREISTPNAATVYIDDKPLKKAMMEFDRSTGFKNLIRKGEKKKRRDSFKQLMVQTMESNKKVLVLVGDGEVVMEVNPRKSNAKGAFISCKVVTVKKPDITGKKGFTLKGVHVDIPSFTGEDREKLDKLIQAEYTGKHSKNPVIAFIGLSFTQSEDDILRIKEHIEHKLINITNMDKKTARSQAPSIIAKIETELGWQNRDYILDAADGIMVARGDLGLQMDIEKVPAIQKKLIQLCNKRGKPVITATEMLKSMTESIEPTRAEGTDVFNAILDGSDAVMTSEETASGKYPFHAIQKMKRIAEEAESYYEMKYIGDDDLRRAANLQRYQEFLKDDYERIDKNSARIREIIGSLSDQIIACNEEYESLEWRQRLYQVKLGRSGEQPTTNRITQATCTMSETEEVKYIIAATTSGRTVRMISRLRPSVMIVGAAHDIINTRKLTVSYGVKPICIGDVPNEEGTEGVFLRCKERVLEVPDLEPSPGEGDMVIFTAGTPLGKPGTTNLIQMRKI